MSKMQPFLQAGSVCSSLTSFQSESSRASNDWSVASVPEATPQQRVFINFEELVEQPQSVATQTEYLPGNKIEPAFTKLKVKYQKLETKNEQLRSETSETVNDLVKLNRKYSQLRKKFFKAKQQAETRENDMIQIQDFLSELLGVEETESNGDYKQIQSQLQILRVRFRRNDVKVTQMKNENEGLEKDLATVKKLLKEVNGKRPKVQVKPVKQRQALTSRPKSRRKPSMDSVTVSEFDPNKMHGTNYSLSLKQLSKRRSLYSSPNFTPDSSDEVAHFKKTKKNLNKYLMQKYGQTEVVFESDEEMYQTGSMDMMVDPPKKPRPISAQGFAKKLELNLGKIRANVGSSKKYKKDLKIRTIHNQHKMASQKIRLNLAPARQTLWNIPTTDGPKSIRKLKQQHVLQIPIQNENAKKNWKRLRSKLKGVIYWNQKLEDIRLYGTGSQIHCGLHHYRSNIGERWLRRQETSSVDGKRFRFKEVKSGWLIHPESKFKHFWNLVVLVLLLYTFTVMPYLVAFEEPKIGDSLWIVDTIVDVLFVFDIFVILNSAIPSEDTLITSRSTIFFRYLKGALLIDLVAVFPFYLITQGSAGRSNNLIRFIRMTRLMRIMRASKLGSLGKSIQSSERSEGIADVLNKQAGAVRLARSVFIVFIMVHFISWMWYFAAKIDNFEPDTWVVRNGLVDNSTGSLYMFAFYWAITTLTTVGLGDVNAGTPAERFICILWMMFGVGFYSFTVGSISSVLSSMDTEAALVEERIEQIKTLAANTELDPTITNRIIKAIKKKAVKVTLNEEQKSNLVMMLSKELRYTVAMDMNQQAAKKIQLFNSSHTAFVANIVPLLTFKRFKRLEVLYEKGQYAEDVFFISEGRVNFVYGKDYIEMKTMTPGSYFGEIEIMEDIPRKVTAITETKCDMYLMNSMIFFTVLREYPSIAQKIVINAKRKKTDLKKVKTEMIDLFEKVQVRRMTLDTLAGAELFEQAQVPKFVAKEEKEPKEPEQPKNLRDDLGVLRNSIDEMQTQLGQLQQRINPKVNGKKRQTIAQAQVSKAGTTIFQ